MAAAPKADLDVRIAQDQRYEGNDWWSWSIWIEGDDDQLDQIDHVVYQLHSTFADPVRTVRSRNNKFRLKADGWGTFTIFARAITHDGAACKLSHELELFYPDEPATRA